MSQMDQPNSPRHARLKEQWRDGQKWETVIEGCDTWVPVSSGGYAQPLWDHRQEYRQVPDSTTAPAVEAPQ